MEETAQVNNPQQVNQPIQTPVENPVPVKLEEKPKKNSGLALILSFTTIIATLIAGFFYFQNLQLRSELQKNLPSLTPTPTATPDETADWKTYTNTKYNYSFKYPDGYTAGQNGVNSDHPETVDFLAVYNEENPDKPRLAVSVWPKSQGNDLEKMANDHYKKMSTYQLPAGFTLYQGMNNEAVKTISQGTFLGIKSFSYTIKGNYIADGTTEYVNPIQEHLYIWLEFNNNIFLISLDNETTMNQILSTFKFSEVNKINCTSPRPEVCTQECIVNPPYICGSDGKSYCTTCQACTNTKVEWYITQNTTCGGK